uniref:WGS project CBMI000000000 data, contig CS3069_c002348 n=1 Tax=Fusarium clavum TaxID=2594811 RepID=A0A090MCM8_9HYPO|nr:unnamed protein product [Fusarium clavum]
MSQQDSDLDSDASISPTNSIPSHSDENMSTSSSTSENQWPIHGRDCHHLGHLEAIPIQRNGTLKLIFKASIDTAGEEWGIRNANCHGPYHDICFKIPGPGNNWIAAITEPAAMVELAEIMKAHDTKGYGYYLYSRLDHYRSKKVQEVIFESFPEGEEEGRVPEGPEMIATLAKRIIGFAALVAP